MKSPREPMIDGYKRVVLRESLLSWVEKLF